MMRCKGSWTLVEFCLAWMLGLGAMAAVGVAGAGQAVPAIATTTVSDTIYRADGKPAQGTVLVSWPAFTTVNGSSVPAGSTSVTIGVNGLLSVALVPNAGSTPMGSYYTVVYHLSDSSVTRDYWVVPVTGSGSGGVKVSAIKSTVLPASVAMQTVTKQYVDTQIATLLTGHPLDSSLYVVKAGDTMTGPLNLPGDPTAPQQASDKNYVDTQVAGLSAGLGQKVSTQPQAAQTVTQPPGTRLQVNNLNGALYASQYATGAGNNGIANAAASPDCTAGCNIVAEQTYTGTDKPVAAALNVQTQVTDFRAGQHEETYRDPLNSTGANAGEILNLTSTRTAADAHAATGSANISGATLVLNHEALAGGNNTFPQQVQGTVPFFKSTFSTLNMTSDNYTVGQHVQVPQTQNCFAVGDCLMGAQFMLSSGGFRDDADEGAHPFDLQFSEDTRVFTGTCASGCAVGSTTVQVTATSGGGTQGEGRYLMDTNPAKSIHGGTLVGGNQNGRQPSATFAGTSFAVSTFLVLAQTVPSQATAIEPGTVTVPIVTSGVPPGFATNTAALPAATGVACVVDQAVSNLPPLNFETAAYVVVDGSHLQLTLHRPHASGATFAAGGLCGFGLEQTADTVGPVRQVFPVIGSTSATSLLYAGGDTSIVGIANLQSAFVNLNFVVASIARTNGVVTVTTANGFGSNDVNGLQLTVQGVTDASYNGTFKTTTTSFNTLTYAEAGADSTSAGGTLTFVTGGYGLYPMAEVLKVYNPVTKAVDGQFTLAANTINWATGDTVEEPHYFQENVHLDTSFVTQYEPRPSLNTGAGVIYQGNNGPGLQGWLINNASAVSNYFGNGGTHTLPSIGLNIVGPWRHAIEMQAGDDAAISVQCNSHGCDRWNSGYDLFQMNTGVGVDRQSYTPQTSTMTFGLRGTNYAFTPNAFTAGTINVTTLNAGSVHGLFTGTVANASLPVFGASGGTHNIGAVPDPGTSAGTTRFLREDGTWAAVNGGAAGSAGPTTNVALVRAGTPQRSSLMMEYLLNEGAGSTAHDTSGNGNDGTISGPLWEGSAGNSTDLNFTAQGEFVTVPTALNTARTWQFAMYQPTFGTDQGPNGVGYGPPGAFGGNPSILCGTDSAHLCLIASSHFAPKSMRFLAFNTDGTESAEYLSSGWHIVTLLCGTHINGVANATKILFDGAEVGGYIRQGEVGTCPLPVGGNYQIGGSTSYGGTWFVGKLGAAWAWSTSLTVNDAAAAAKSALDYIRSKGAVTETRRSSHVAPMVIGGLDSRTYGVGLPSSADSWINSMALTDASYTRLNLGVPGQLALDACPQFDATYGAQMGTGSGPVVVVLWGGVNDQGVPAREIADSLRCMVQKGKALGARMVVATEVSAFSPQGTSGDAAKNALNTILRSEAFGWGLDNLADLATDARLGADGASANVNCFPDTLHPGPGCEPYIAAIMGDAVNELLGSTETNRHTTANANYQEVAGDRFLDLSGTAAQAVTLPSCVGYSLKREVVNVGSSAATLAPFAGEALVGNASLAVNSRAVFVPVPGTLAASGCRWQRTE